VSARHGWKRLIKMRKMRTIGPAIALFTLLLGACTSNAVPTAVPASAFAVAGSAMPSTSSAALRASPTPLPLTFQTSAQQARMVATLVAFLDAFNAGRVEVAVALFAANVTISDCDYRAVRVITATGAEAAGQWLRERVADHDQLVLGSVRNDNPDAATGSHVVGVTFTRRASDTLRSLGFANGIAPGLAAKVGFTSTDDRINGFGNGPFGGSAESCRPA
jgi:hypothetical protein